MRLATIDSVATTQALRNNLQALGSYSSTVNGDIDKIITEFDKNYSQLNHQTQPLTAQLASSLEPTRSPPASTSRPKLTGCIKTTLIPTFTHESLMGMAKSKFNYLQNKGTWDNKIVATTATINKLKGQLKLSPQLSALVGKGDKKKKCQKNKNKKDKSDRVMQKKDNAWKKVPPKDGEKHKKKHDERTYFWCEHHMAWTKHSPKECCFGKERKGEKASSATVTAAAVTTVNLSYQARLSILAKFRDKE